MRACVSAVLCVACLAVPVRASAQAVVNPATAVFQQADEDFSVAAAYHVDFYRCGSVATDGTCVGRATAPFQAGIDVPKTQVMSTTGSLVHGIDLRFQPVAGALTSLPAGVGFVSTLTLLVDTAAHPELSNSAASADSNSFFVRARVLAAPTNLVVR